MAKSGGKFGKDASHAVYAPYEDLHLSVGSFDGGQCVGPHGRYYVQRDSCSYRWQAHHRATGPDSSHYPKSNKVGIRHRSRAEARILWNNKALDQDPDLSQDNPKVGAKAFRTAFAPWNNNAHHLLPDAQLRGGIFGVAEGVAEAEALIIKGLLTGKYNVNHWKNMMILPQSEKVGCALSLPTHPQGDSHPTYSAKVRAAVDGALSCYKSIVADMKAGTFSQNHDVPDPEDVVGALEAISDGIHGEIIAMKAVVKARCDAGDDTAINHFAERIATALE